jgi:PAS domain S-box-containing protein
VGDVARKMRGIPLLQNDVTLDFEALNLIPGYVYVRAKNGVYQYANDRFAKLLGFGLGAELIGQNADKLQEKTLLSNPALSQIVFLDDRFFAKKRVKIVETELSVQDETGSAHKFISKRMPVYQKAKMVAVLNVMLPQPKKDAVDEISFLENVVTFVPGSVYWMDKAGVYLGCNEECASLLGLPKEAVVGKTVFELGTAIGLSEFMAASFARDDFEVMRTGQPILNREENSFVDGAQKTVYQLTNKAPIFDVNNNVLGLVGNTVNITKQKETEQALIKAKQEAEAANKAKSEFLAMMTHELRTPLNIVMGMAQLMQHDRCSLTEREEFLRAMMASGKSLLGLINNILDFSKMQSGALALRPAPFALEELLQQLAMEFSVRAQEMKVDFKLKKPRSLPEYLVADRMRLRQIIYNLCDNAMKFTGEGVVTLKLQLLKAEKKGHVKIKFVVQDTGIGIPSEKLDSIFEEFSQVSTEKHDEYSRRYGGVGLGLSIVKKMVDLMDGTLQVKSEIGHGTAFSCTFDFALPTAKEIAIIHDETQYSLDEQLTLPASRILVVEDEEMNQQVITHMLARLNATVGVAENGKEALEKLKNEYDLVLMDMSLPDFSGPEIVERYRSAEPEDRHQHIVAVTANVHADDQKKCIDAGMDGFLTKPIMLDQLRKVLLDKLVFHAN